MWNPSLFGTQRFPKTACTTQRYPSPFSVAGLATLSASSSAHEFGPGLLREIGIGERTVLKPALASVCIG